MENNFSHFSISQQTPSIPLPLISQLSPPNYFPKLFPNVLIKIFGIDKNSLKTTKNFLIAKRISPKKF